MLIRMPGTKADVFVNPADVTGLAAEWTCYSNQSINNRKGR